MSISQSGTSWDRDDELGMIKAIRSIRFEADSKKDAEFLAELAGCFRRGKVDYDQLVKLAVSILLKSALSNQK